MSSCTFCPMIFYKIAFNLHFQHLCKSKFFSMILAESTGLVVSPWACLPLYFIDLNTKFHAFKTNKAIIYTCVNS